MQTPDRHGQSVVAVFLRAVFIYSDLPGPKLRLLGGVEPKYNVFSLF